MVHTAPLLRFLSTEDWKEELTPEQWELVHDFPP